MPKKSEDALGLYPLCFVPYERKERGREAGPRLRGTKGLRLQTHSFLAEAARAAGQCRNKETICYVSVHNRTDTILRHV